LSVIDLNDLFPEPGDGSKRGPLPKQLTFMNAVLEQKGPAYCLYSGGVGSGKTLIGCITTIILAVLYPGDYLVCRLFNPELKLTTYKTFLDICPKELIVEHRVADQIVRIRSQGGKISNVIFRGLEEPDKHRSLNLNAAYIDEASQVSEEAFSLLQSRLRGAHVRKIYATTNPNGHSWLYRYWIKRDWPTEKAKKNFLHVSAPSTENVHLPADYVDNMLSSWTKERIDREVMGSWDAFAGQIYSEFSRNVHVVKPFKIPDDWTRFAGLDHGFTNPACVLWCAMDYDSNVYVYREFYHSEWIIEEICRGNKKTSEPGIVDMNGKDKLEGIWIDPSTKAKRDANGSHYDTYLEFVPKSWSLIPANNAVSAGIDRVKELMKPHPVTGQPRLFIFETCSNLIEEITQYKWKEKPPTAASSQNEPEEPVKKDDHSCDALRYAIMSRPEEPKKTDTNAKKRQAATLEASISRELHDLKRGGGGYKDPWGETYIKDSYDNE
jgi:phage terminase large subunit